MSEYNGYMGVSHNSVNIYDDEYLLAPEKNTRIVEDVEAVEDKDYRVRVVRFYEGSSHYCIQYSLDGGEWDTIKRVADLFHKLTGLRDDHPILSENFDELVERAKNEFDTYSKLVDHQKANQEYYESLKNKYTAIDAKKNKSWEL